MREMRRKALYDLIRDPESRILTTEDLYVRLRQRWAPDAIGQAIADNVVAGVLAESADGQLIVGPDAHLRAA